MHGSHRTIVSSLRACRTGPPAALCLLLTACIIDGGPDDGGGGGKADDPNGGECTSPAYGDGTCDVDLECAAPDIDCFVIFDDQQTAETWYAGFEALLAAEEFRAPRAIVPESDPSFQRMRQLLDEGWEAYKEVKPVGDLASARPALIVIEDPAVNAFVVPDVESGKAGFAVIVQTGLLAQDSSEEAMLGLVMHELEHAVALHIVADVKDRIRRFYVAHDGEPLGFTQLDDPLARQHGEAWRALASEVGPFSTAELGGLPFGQSQVSRVLGTVLQSIPPEGAAACEGPLSELRALQNELFARVSLLDTTLDLQPGEVVPRIDAALGRVRDECLAGFEHGFIDVVAAMAGVSPDDIRAQMTPEDLALVDGVHFVDAIANLTKDRRARMRAAEETFARDSYRPWTALRYYSYEEAADDATVPVLHAMGLPAAGLGEFLFGAQDEAIRPGCRALLDAGEVPPYGADLSDEHHATCWRVDHVQRVADSGLTTGEAAARRARPASPAPVHRLPIPRPLSDLIVY